MIKRQKPKNDSNSLTLLQNGVPGTFMPSHTAEGAIGFKFNKCESFRTLIFHLLIDVLFRYFSVRTSLQHTARPTRRSTSYPMEHSRNKNTSVTTPAVNP